MPDVRPQQGSLWEEAAITIFHLNVPARAALVLFTILCATACQTWQVESIAPAHVFATRQPKQVRVQRTDGSQLVLNSPVLRADTLSGVVLQGSQYQEAAIPLADVRQLQTRRFSIGRTVALGVGVVVVAYYASGVLYWAECSWNKCD